MKLKIKSLTGFAAATLLAGGMLAASSSVQADHTITIRIASGHPPTVVYAGLMKNFFQPELKKAIESKTDHKVNFIEGYSGSIVKVFDTFEGVQNGVVDIGGFCYCFEASKLPMHAYQIMLPFGTMDPVQSVGAAADIYEQFPSLAKRFQGFDQTLLAIIGDGGYNLGTNFAWKKLSDLKGHKILGGWPEAMRIVMVWSAWTALLAASMPPAINVAAANPVNDFILSFTISSHSVW